MNSHVGVSMLSELDAAPRQARDAAAKANIKLYSSNAVCGCKV